MGYRLFVPFLAEAKHRSLLLTGHMYLLYNGNIVTDYLEDEDNTTAPETSFWHDLRGKSHTRGSGGDLNASF